MSAPQNAASCRWPGGQGDASLLPDPAFDVDPTQQPAVAEAVLAGGCFWCVDAVFRALEGVQEVTCGYAGGDKSTASYRQVCSGATGHAEVVRVRFDPQTISFGALLKVFFGVAHDPTQRNRQGNDVGPQYRSAVFYSDDEQRSVAASYIEQLNAAGVFSAPIATTLEPNQGFFVAEDEHQNFAARYPDAGYIRVVAAPKMEKLRQTFAAQLRR